MRVPWTCAFTSPSTYEYWSPYTSVVWATSGSFGGRQWLADPTSLVGRGRADPRLEHRRCARPASRRRTSFRRPTRTDCRTPPTSARCSSSDRPRVAGKRAAQSNQGVSHAKVIGFRTCGAGVKSLANGPLFAGARTLDCWPLRTTDACPPSTSPYEVPVTCERASCATIVTLSPPTILMSEPGWSGGAGPVHGQRVDGRRVVRFQRRACCRSSGLAHGPVDRRSRICAVVRQVDVRRRDVGVRRRDRQACWAWACRCGRAHRRAAAAASAATVAMLTGLASMSRHDGLGSRLRSQAIVSHFSAAGRAGVLLLARLGRRSPSGPAGSAPGSESSAFRSGGHAFFSQFDPWRRSGRFGSPRRWPPRRLQAVDASDLASFASSVAFCEQLFYRPRARRRSD